MEEMFHVEHCFIGPKCRGVFPFGRGHFKDKPRPEEVGRGHQKNGSGQSRRRKDRVGRSSGRVGDSGGATRVRKWVISSFFTRKA